MALITSDCGKMRSLRKKMALTTSDCVPLVAHSLRTKSQRWDDCMPNIKKAVQVKSATAYSCK